MKVEKIYRTKINHSVHKSTTTFTDSIKFDKSISEKVEKAHG
jgi:hypothetical protein